MITCVECKRNYEYSRSKGHTKSSQRVLHMSDDPYRVPKSIPGKNNLKDYMNDGWIAFTVLLMGVSFIVGLIVGVLADGLIGSY